MRLAEISPVLFKPPFEMEQFAEIAHLAALDSRARRNIPSPSFGRKTAVLKWQVGTALCLAKRKLKSSTHLASPIVEKNCEDGDFADISYGLSSMQGWRRGMEDAHSICLRLPEPFSDFSFFAIFDGHGGPWVSKHCSRNLLSTILETSQFSLLAKLKERGAILEEKFELKLIRDGLVNGFLKLDEKMTFDTPAEDRSGSTCVCVIVTPRHFHVANLGDSRLVLVKGGAVAFATEDHKPYNGKEKERIEKAGGKVVIQRVNGALAVSRSFGDYDYKEVPGRAPSDQLISPEPDITSIRRVHGEDQCLILACDGIWDVMSNEEMARLILPRTVTTGMETLRNISNITNDVLDYCLLRGSRDNMTVLLVNFLQDQVKEMRSRRNSLLKEFPVKEPFQELYQPAELQLLQQEILEV